MISQNQNIDKAVDVTVVIEEIVTQIQNSAQEDSEKETQQVDLSWTSDVNVNMQRLVKDTGHGSSLRKADGRERYASPGRG